MDFATAICSTQELSLPYDPFQCPSRSDATFLCCICRGWITRESTCARSNCSEQIMNSNNNNNKINE